MATTIIDGRGRRGSSVGSDALWRQRVVDAARKAFNQSAGKILDGDFKDIGNKGVDITIPKKTINEPSITQQGGSKHIVAPGNREYEPGDWLPKPEKNSCNSGGPGETGQDKFTAHIDKDEVRRILLEGLGLPKLEKKSDSVDKKTLQRAGFSLTGAFHTIDLVRTKKRMMGRLTASSSQTWDDIINLLKAKKEILLGKMPPSFTHASNALDAFDYVSKAMEIDILKKDCQSIMPLCDLSAYDRTKIEEIDQRVDALEQFVQTIPNFDESHDPRYRRHEVMPLPDTKAVMFCMRDVSGSVTEEMKRQAKLFYWLLFNLLEHRYGEGKVATVWIRHTDTAKQVDVQTFFDSQETGGTMVSSALELMIHLVKQHYTGPEWNIYGAQHSDGDNYTSDNKLVEQLIRTIMGMAQAYCYMETKETKHESNLWQALKSFPEEFGDRFKMAKVKKLDDVIPIFRKMYEDTEKAQKAAAFTL